MKICPICGHKFKSRKKLQITCSHSCSNTYFRSGPNNGNWKEDAYRTTCFLHHDKKCLICKEKNIVEVHHIDRNKSNNSSTNLIPLCPTHHRYCHSKYKEIIEKKIDKYLKRFVKDESTIRKNSSSRNSD
jgi:5-methylcytosine-specific restriction endonuclease McrA